MFLKKEKNCFLILAASEVNCNYTKNCKKKFIYLNSGPSLAIEKIVSFYKKFKKPIYVAVDDEYINHKMQAFDNCKFIRVKKTNSALLTLKNVIKVLEKKNIVNFTINPIHVIPSEELKETSISLSRKMFRKGNWASVEKTEDRVFLLNRDDTLSDGKLSYAFTGRINARISDVNKFFLHSKTENLNDLSFLAFYLFENLNYGFQHETFLDLTHDILSTETKLRNINCRNFHEIEFSKQSNTITKFSTNKQSQINVIRFYESLDNNKRRYFPSFIKSKKTNDVYSYTLEYIPLPSLSELFLHEKLGHHIWFNMISKLKNIYDDLYPDSGGIKGLNSVDFFSGKLAKRENSFVKLFEKNNFNAVKNIYENPYELNNKKMPPLKITFQKLSKNLKFFDKNSISWFGHGDFCFNNILIDPYSLSIKLIDPKASNTSGNQYIGFVPKNYDLAKLNHSFVGLYDSVVANMFTLHVIGKNKFKFDIFYPDKFIFIKDIFQEVFFENNQDLIREINQITSSLFLSMLPLHAEDPKRVLVLAMIGNLFFETYNISSSNIFE